MKKAPLFRLNRKARPVHITDYVAKPQPLRKVDDTTLAIILDGFLDLTNEDQRLVVRGLHGRH